MSNPIPREDRSAAGMLTMFLAVVVFTCIDTSAKWLTLAAVPVMQIVFVRYLGHFVYGLIFYLPQEGIQVFRSRAPGRQFLRSLFLFGSTVCNFFAIQALPLTVTTTIMFAGPVVVTLLAIPILGEKVGLRRIIAVCVGFAGVIVVMQPWGASFHPAMFLSLIALVVASLYFIMTRMLAGVETNATQQIWASGLATVALAPFAWPVWIWPAEPLTWVVMVLIGFFGLTGHIMATLAHRWADASILAPLIYCQLFLVAIVAIVIFDTWPTVYTLGGGAIIIASGLYIWHRERLVSPKD